MANLRILIVDPDVNFSTELRKQLSRAGVTVLGESDYGAEALSLTRQTQPDAVLVAWQEPTARAEQTLEALSVLLPTAPLVAYSEIDNLEATRQAIQAGAQDYLPKPLASKDVVDSLFKALAQIERRRTRRSRLWTSRLRRDSRRPLWRQRWYRQDDAVNEPCRCDFKGSS